MIQKRYMFLVNDTGREFICPKTGLPMQVRPMLVALLTSAEANGYADKSTLVPLLEDWTALCGGMSMELCETRLGDLEILSEM